MGTRLVIKLESSADLVLASLSDWRQSPVRAARSDHWSLI